MEVKKDGGGLHVATKLGGRFKALHPELGLVPINIIRLDTDDIKKANEAVVSDPDHPRLFKIMGCAATGYAGVKNPGDTSAFSVKAFVEEAPTTPNSVEPSPQRII